MTQASHRWPAKWTTAVVVLVIALVAALTWVVLERHRIADGHAWQVVAGVEPAFWAHDDDRILVDLDRGSGAVVLERADGAETVRITAEGRFVEGALFDHGAMLMDRADDGTTTMGLLDDEGEWIWREEVPSDAELRVIDPGGHIAVLRDAVSGTLLGYETRTGDAVWEYEAELIFAGRDFSGFVPRADGVVVMADGDAAPALLGVKDGEIVVDDLEAVLGEVTNDEAPGWIYPVTGRQAVALHREGTCEIVVVNEHGAREADWAEDFAPPGCTRLASSAGRYAYYARADERGPERTEIVAVDLETAQVQRLGEVAQDVERVVNSIGEQPFGDTFAVRDDGAMRLWDTVAATETWTVGWPGRWAVIGGPDAVLLHRETTPFERFVGGVGTRTAVFELRDARGGLRGRAYLDGVWHDAMVLAGGGAVVSVGDTVTLIGR